MTRLGIIHLPSWDPAGLPAFATAVDGVEALDELWLWEDCFASGGLTSSAVALALTSRVEVGIGVLPVPLRNVALAAMEIATLARQFPGRFHVGVGHGVLDWMGQAGVRAKSPMTLLGEYVDALRSLLAGSSVTTSGSYVSLQDVALEWPPVTVPPLYVGAVRAKTLALAAASSDGTILTASADRTVAADARSVLDAAGAGKRLTTFVPATTSAQETAALVRSFADAGSDAIVLEPARSMTPQWWLPFVRDEVLPALQVTGAS